MRQGESYCYAHCPICFKAYGYIGDRQLPTCDHMKGLYTPLKIMPESKTKEEINNHYYLFVIIVVVVNIIMWSTY